MVHASFASRLSVPVVFWIFRSRRLQAAYVRVFSSQAAQETNHKLLKLCLRATGYNPTDTGEESGEAALVKRYSDLGLRRVIDVGANVGKYSRMLLRCGFDSVVAFEPHPACLEDLRALAGEYPGRITVESSAVGSTAGKLPLHFNPSNLALASLAEEANRVAYVSNSRTVEVEVTTLNSYFSGYPHPIELLKIDTEGFERDVLRGAREMRETNPPKVIQLEFNSHHLYRGVSLDSMSRLLRGEYRGYRLLPGSNGLLPIDPASPYSNFYFFSNFVFVRANFFSSLRPGPEMSKLRSLARYYRRAFVRKQRRLFDSHLERLVFQSRWGQTMVPRPLFDTEKSILGLEESNEGIAQLIIDGGGSLVSRMGGSETRAVLEV